MIPVMRYSGAEHGAEFAAGIVPHFTQELPFDGIAPPAVPHRDFTAALKRKSRNVDRIAEAMLAHLGAKRVVARAAGVGRCDIDPDNAFAETLLRGGLDRMCNPIVEWSDHSAIEGRRTTEVHARYGTQTPSIADLASIALIDIVNFLGVPDAVRIDQALRIGSDQAGGGEMGSR